MKTDHGLLDLDDLCREKLRALIRTDVAVSAGQLVLLGLDEVKTRLGEAWPKYAARVHEQTIKCFAQMLEPSEVFLQLAEDRYVIVFHDRDAAAAKIICTQIVRSVCEIFLGTPELSGLSADSVVMMLDPETVARTLGVEIADGGHGFDGQREMALADNGVRLVSEPQGAAALEGEICFVPVWDMQRNTVYTYKPSILSLRGRRRLSGYHALGDGRDERAVRLLDFACLDAAARAIETAAQQDSLVIMTVPVSFRTLSNREASLDYFGACSILPERVRRQTIFELADLNSGTPVWRAYEILSTLKRFSRGLFVRIDKSWRDFSIFKELAIQGLVFDVEMDLRPQNRIAEDLKRVAAEAKARGWSFVVSGVYSRELAVVARAAGARLLYGHYLVAAVSKPLPPAALDWMALGRLVAEGGDNRALDLESLR